MRVLAPRVAAATGAQTLFGHRGSYELPFGAPLFRSRVPGKDQLVDAATTPGPTDAPSEVDKVDPTPTTSVTAGRVPTWLRVVLRIAALAAVGAAAILVLWGPATTECQTTNATTTKDRSTTDKLSETCEEVRPDVVDVLPLIALAAILLLGELAELSIPGLLTLKTRVEEQQVRQERLERELVDVRVTASQSQSVVNQNYWPDSGYQNPQEASRSAHKKADAEGSGEPLDGEPGVVPRESTDSAALKYYVLEAYERLSPFVFIAQDLQRVPVEQIYRRMPPVYRSVLERLSPADLDRLRDWFKRFRREIDSVRAVRNSVAHPPALVTEVDLNATLETIQTLTSDLERRGLTFAGFDL